MKKLNRDELRKVFGGGQGEDIIDTEYKYDVVLTVNNTEILLD